MTAARPEASGLVAPRPDWLSVADWERSAQVQKRLLEVAGPANVLPFDRFVEVALYDPEFGYYTHPGAEPIGPRGDFYTAADMGPVFGATIARRVALEWDRMGRPSDFHVVEAGAGAGKLAESIVVGLRAAGTDLGGWTYSLVERSQELASLAHHRVAAAGAGSGLSVRSLPGVGADGPFRGVVLANELLDALPSKRLTYEGGTWREACVRWTGERWVWAPGEPVTSIPGPILPVPDWDGTALEYSPRSGGFLREVGDHLTDGTAIFIDYGIEETELVRAHTGGTLEGLYRHRITEDALAFPGALDLSVVVNWTRVKASAEVAGLVEASRKSQAVALGDWGIAPIAEAWVAAEDSEEGRVRRRLQVKNLLFGFGNFWVWELHPRAEATAPPI